MGPGDAPHPCAVHTYKTQVELCQRMGTRACPCWGGTIPEQRRHLALARAGPFVGQDLPALAQGWLRRGQLPGWGVQAGGDMVALSWEAAWLPGQSLCMRACTLHRAPSHRGAAGTACGDPLQPPRGFSGAGGTCKVRLGVPRTPTGLSTRAGSTAVSPGQYCARACAVPRHPHTVLTPQVGPFHPTFSPVGPKLCPPVSQPYWLQQLQGCLTLPHLHSDPPASPGTL